VIVVVTILIVVIFDILLNMMFVDFRSEEITNLVKQIKDMQTVLSV